MANKCVPKGFLRKAGISEDEFDGLSNQQQFAAIEDYQNGLRVKKKQSEMQALKFRNVIEIIDNYTDKKGNKNIKQGLEALMHTDKKERPRINASGKGIGDSIDAKIRGTRARYQSMMQPMMERLAPKLLGMVDQIEAGHNMVRAIFGTLDDPAFRQFAEDWKKVTMNLFERWDRAFGTEGKLRKDWNLPTSHSKMKIGKAKFDSWFKSAKENFNFESMDLKNATDIEGSMRKLYENITTEGYHGKGILQSKETSKFKTIEKRFVKFKDSEAWIRYHDEFSDSDVFDAMTDYVDSMINDIVLAETLGPNPDVVAKSAAAYVDAQHINKKGVSDKTSSTVAMNSYANFSGGTAPHSQRLSDFAGTLRNVTTGISLPLAVVAAPSDMITNLITAHYTGIPMMKSLKETVAFMASPGAGKRKQAGLLMMQLDFMSDVAHSAKRYSDVTGKSFSSKFASLTLRGGLLNYWTVANKAGYHFAFMSTLADKGFTKNSDLMATFERHGLDKNDIAEVVAAPNQTINGKEFLDPSKLKPETAEKVTTMIIAETKYAVTEGDSRSAGFLNQGTRRGTYEGEGLRLVAMFKGFPVNFALNHWSRTVHGRKNGAAYAANLIIGMTVMGGLSLQLRQIVKGDETRPWDSNKFWRDAAIQGGVFSVLGDVFSKEMRDYGSMADFIGGPAIGLINNVFWKGMLGDLDDARVGDREFEKMFRGAVGASARYVPGQFFYLKSAWDKVLLDEMRNFGDPKYELKKMRRDAQTEQDFEDERW